MLRWLIDKVGDRWQVTNPDGEKVGPLHADLFRAHALVASLAREAIVAGAASFAEGDRRAWSGDIAFEDTDTRDGRFIVADALFWGDPPLPLMWLTENQPGHMEAYLCGSIETLTRDGSTIRATGTFDDSDDGARAVETLENHPRYGVSIDLAVQEEEVICTEEDEDGWCIEAEWRVLSGEIMGATGVPFPAFADAFVELTDSGSESSDDDTEADDAESDSEGDEAASAEVISIAASGIRANPPAEWFENPGLTAPTPLTITDDGRIFGHLAAWGTCHIGIEGACVTPPRSETDYAYFRTGSIYAEGCDCAIPVGTITMDTGHENDLRAPHRVAASHYDNTGTQVADIAAGDDEVGIWVAGALRPGVTEEQVRALRAAALSGDWRSIGGNLELVAALAVNVPGFPVPHAAARVAGGNPVALVAAGVVRQPDPEAEWRREIERRLGAVERVAEPLRGQAADALAASISGGRENGRAPKDPAVSV